MSETHAIRCYEYVNAPYERVREAIHTAPAGLFQQAATAATTRAKALVSSLHVNVGSLEVGTDVIIEVGTPAEEASAPGIHGPRTRLPIEWRAARASRFFPQMKATLAFYPISGGETQIDLLGDYQPPLGLLGEAVDAVVGRRVAEATVHRFVQDVALRLRQQVGGH